MHVDVQKRFPTYHVCPKCLAALLCGKVIRRFASTVLQVSDEVGLTLVDWERGNLHWKSLESFMQFTSFCSSGDPRSDVCQAPGALACPFWVQSRGPVSGSSLGVQSRGSSLGGPVSGVQSRGSILGVHFGVHFGGPFWGSILGVHFGGPFWGSILGVHFGGPFWGSILGVHFGGPFWGSILGVHFGGPFWGSILGSILGSGGCYSSHVVNIRNPRIKPLLRRC